MRVVLDLSSSGRKQDTSPELLVLVAVVGVGVGEVARDHPRAGADARGCPTRPEGGPGWPGRAHRHSRRPRHRWPRATAAKEGRGGAREAKRRAAEPVAHTDGHEGAQRQGDAEVASSAMAVPRRTRERELERE